MEKNIYLHMYILYNTVNWVKLCIYCLPSHEAVRVHIFYKVFPKQSYLVTGFLWFVTETKIWYVRNSWWSKKIKRTIAASISVFASAISWKFKTKKPPKKKNNLITYKSTNAYCDFEFLQFVPLFHTEKNKTKICSIINE